MAISSIARVNGANDQGMNGKGIGHLNHEEQKNSSKIESKRNCFDLETTVENASSELEESTKTLEADDSLREMWPQFRKAMPRRWRDRSSPTRYGEQGSYLQIVGNIKEWIKENLKAFSRIESLGFDSLNLKILPSEFLALSLSFIKKMRIADNSLTSLPENYGLTWKKVELVDLSQNKLAMLPSYFGHAWSRLRVLGLNDNPLGSLPLNFGVKWVAIQYLYLDRINLKNLEGNFGIQWIRLGLLHNLLVFNDTSVLL